MCAGNEAFPARSIKNGFESEFKTKTRSGCQPERVPSWRAGRLAIRENFRGIGPHAGFEREKRKRKKREKESCYGVRFALVYHLLMELSYIRSRLK